MLTKGNDPLKMDNNHINLLRSVTMAAEAAGHLLPEQLQLIHGQGWFNLYNPLEWGGQEYSLPAAVQLLEKLASIDGSLGWVVTLCSGASMFAGYFQAEVRQEIVSTKHMCIAGSGLASGQAKKVPGGYEISGYWPYASGARHATHFTVNCILQGDEESGRARSFVFMKEEVTLHPHWNYMGLNATGGDAFSVNELFVRELRAFDIDTRQTKHPLAIYRYPFQQFAETTLAINTCGMCHHFLELLEPLAGRRHQSAQYNELFLSCKEKIKEVRQMFYGHVEASWQTIVEGGEIAASELQAISAASRKLSATCRESVSRLYPYAGMSAAQPSSAINQVWRNIFTASQHSLLLE